MKIGIDTFGCDHGKSNGGSYLVSILKELPKSVGDDCIEFELFGLESDRYDFNLPDSIKYVSVNLPESQFGVKVWHDFGCNAFFKKQKYDAVIFPCAENFLPIKCKIPSIVIINEVLSIRLNKMPFSERFKSGISIKGMKKIVVPSQFVKKDLKNLHLNPEKITVIHNGIDHSVFYPRGNSEIDSDFVDLKPFAIQKPYFIYASKMSSPLKKHCELIRAFSDFKERTGLPHRLVLAGDDGDYSDFVKKEAMSSKYVSDIFLTGFFPHDTYPELYAGSAGCVYPSVCEGVGLPVIEAMSMGVPVVCAKNGAIPEATGENAIYFDGESESDLSLAMEKLVNEDESTRKKRIENGLEWSSRFDWKKTSDELVSLIKVLLSKKKK